MNKVVLIIGLPGSGKTYLAKTKYVPMGYVLIDDPKETPKTQGEDIVLTDPHLCNENIREQCINFFEKIGYEVECIFFENNEEKCKKLIERRNDGRIIKTFKVFKYTIPKGITPIEIYSGD